MNAKVCKGTTVRGKNCKRLVKDGDYCCYHTSKPECKESKILKPKKVEETSKIQKKAYPKSKFEKLDECCVCVEALTDEDYLSCGHWIHTSCVVKSGKQECPICRTELILSEQDREQIRKIAKAREDEEVEAQHQSLRNEEVINHIITLAFLNEIENRRIGGQQISDESVVRQLFIVYRRRQ